MSGPTPNYQPHFTTQQLAEAQHLFSILQRKVLTPNDLRDLEYLEERWMEFQTFYNRTARPFNWKFTRTDLEERLQMLG